MRSLPRSNLKILSSRNLLNSLGPARPLDPAAEVAIADRYLAYETRFCRPVDLHRGRAASQLLRFVRDPVARTSFRNIFGYALASTAHWDEATALTDEQLRDVERCRLDFVVPYARLLHAMVATGRRDYDGCASQLAAAEAQARSTGDLAALQMVTALRGRASDRSGLFEEAVVQCGRGHVERDAFHARGTDGSSRLSRLRRQGTCSVRAS